MAAAAAVALAPPLISAARENDPTRFFLIPTTKEGVEKLFFSNYDGGGKFIVISLN